MCYAEELELTADLKKKLVAKKMNESTVARSKNIRVTENDDYVVLLSSAENMYEKMLKPMLNDSPRSLSDPNYKEFLGKCIKAGKKKRVNQI